MSDFLTAIPAGQGLPAAMQGVGTVFNFMGNMGAASASRRAGEAARNAAAFEAAQLNQQAGQSQAASQRKAMEERRRAQIIASRAQAVAGASGGGVSDPTVQNILADIDGEGAYRAGVALYQGVEKARLLRMGADAKLYEGEVAEQGGENRQQAYQIAALGGLATGGASLYGKYGKGGPKASGALNSSSNWLDAGTEGYSNFG